MILGILINAIKQKNTLQININRLITFQSQHFIPNQLQTSKTSPNIPFKSPIPNFPPTQKHQQQFQFKVIIHKINKCMRRRKRQPQQNRHIQVQQSNVYFDQQANSNIKCAICRRPGELINPCECNSKYHQRCLLLFIKGRIQRLLNRHRQVDLTAIKCDICSQQFHFVFRYKTTYNCETLVDKLSKDCCNIHIIFIALVLILIIVTVTLFVKEWGGIDNSKKNSVFIGLVTAIAIQGLILLLLLAHCFNKYLSKRQLILERVYQLIDLGSLMSNSSDDNKIEDEWEVIVRS